MIIYNMIPCFCVRTTTKALRARRNTELNFVFLRVLSALVVFNYFTHPYLVAQTKSTLNAT